MLLPPEDQYHVGIVVHDVEAARDRLTSALGYEWGADVESDYTIQLPEGPFDCVLHMQYSVTEPRLELVQAIEGTPFQPSTSGLHHLGYWCSDVRSTSAELERSGWTWECGGNLEDGAPGWAYHLNPLGVRVELVSLRMKEIGIEALWLPTGG